MKKLKFESNGRIYLILDNYIVPKITEKDTYILLGGFKDLSEEKAQGIVEKGSYIGTYKNYLKQSNAKSNQYKFAKVSLKSLILSKGAYIGTNPFYEFESEPDWDTYSCYNEYD